MKDSILFWLDTYLTYFGIAKSLQEIHESDLFAIIDTPDKPKKFFQEQNLVNFKKVWYLHDHIVKSKKPDLPYLKYFEEKYNIHLWLLGYNERIFFNYNIFYKFSINEVLSILEQECKLFELILDDIKPDFIVMKTTDLHYHKLFHSLCRIKGIKILMLRKVRFGGRCVIAEDMNEITDLERFCEALPQARTIEELQNYLKNNNYFDLAVDFSNKFIKSKIGLLNAALKFLFSNSKSIKTNYTYSGMTKTKVLIANLKFRLVEKYRELFVNRNFVRTIDTSSPFIYFPLHMQIESVLLVDAPFYTNQLETITHVVKSLPIGYKLYVKDAPLNKVRGWRSISFYKEIMKLPNVVMIHHSVTPEEIITKCSLVISISGTSAMEAAFYKKPSIVFADTDFTVLPSVHKLKTIDELPQAIKLSLKKDVDISTLNKYVNFIDKNTFKFDEFRLLWEADKRFFNGGFLQDVEISVEEVRSYLDEFNLEFKQLASEHLNKILQYKANKSKLAND